jgi:single-strand DNA-binding protein
MYQKITLIGNLGRDPEMRYTPSGQQVTTFSMATTEKWTGQDGKLQERTIWWRITVWGKNAESCNQYLKKGSKVFVEGRITGDEKGNPKTWTGQDGSVRASFEVTALPNGIKFLSSRAEGGGHGDLPPVAETEAIPDDSDIPF